MYKINAQDLYATDFVNWLSKEGYEAEIVLGPTTDDCKLDSLWFQFLQYFEGDF